MEWWKSGKCRWQFSQCWSSSFKMAMLGQVINCFTPYLKFQVVAEMTHLYKRTLNGLQSSLSDPASIGYYISGLESLAGYISGHQVYILNMVLRSYGSNGLFAFSKRINNHQSNHRVRNFRNIFWLDMLCQVYNLSDLMVIRAEQSGAYITYFMYYSDIYIYLYECMNMETWYMLIRDGLDMISS